MAGARGRSGFQVAQVAPPVWARPARARRSNLARRPARQPNQHPHAGLPRQHPRPASLMPSQTQPRPHSPTAGPPVKVRGRPRSRQLAGLAAREPPLCARLISPVAPCSLPPCQRRLRHVLNFGIHGLTATPHKDEVLQAASGAGGEAHGWLDGGQARDEGAAAADGGSTLSGGGRPETRQRSLDDLDLVVKGRKRGSSVGSARVRPGRGRGPRREVVADRCGCSLPLPPPDPPAGPTSSPYTRRPRRPRPEHRPRSRPRPPSAPFLRPPLPPPRHSSPDAHRSRGRAPRRACTPRARSRAARTPTACQTTTSRRPRASRPPCRGSARAASRARRPPPSSTTRSRRLRAPATPGSRTTSRQTRSPKARRTCRCRPRRQRRRPTASSSTATTSASARCARPARACSRASSYSG